MSVLPARPYYDANASGGTLEEGTVTNVPLATILLLVGFVTFYLVELRLAPGGEDIGSNPMAEILMGGLTGSLARAGQWYRLLSSAFLHANAQHLIGNAMAMGLAGYALERIVGHAWILCIFVLGAVCGGLATIFWMPPSMVTVGASGGVMAVLGALFMTSFRLPRGHARSRAQGRAAFFGIPSLIPLHASSALHVNYAAHTGGAVFGLLIGFLLLGGWEDYSERPPYAVGATVLAAFAAFSAACSAYAVSINYGYYGPASRFFSTKDMPRRSADIVAQGETLAFNYPYDARARFYAGVAHLLKKDRPGAESELEQAIGLDDNAPGLYSRDLSNNMRILLATLKLQDGHRIEAVAVVRPFCEQADWAHEPPRLVSFVTATHLCR